MSAARFGFSLLAFFTFASTVYANSLQWEQTSFDRKAAVGDKTAKVVYSFTNAGTDAVTITDIRTCCSCTIAKLAKKTYAPGEKGELPITYKFGDHHGQQEKVILVQTAEKGISPYVLTLRVDIPDSTEINGAK